MIPRRKTLVGSLILGILIFSNCGNRWNQSHPIIIGSYAVSDAQIENIILLARSLRQFGGSYCDAPIWLYIEEGLQEDISTYASALDSLGIRTRISQTPEDAAWFYFAGKVFAAGLAESEARGKTDVLAWLDEDTIILQEPGELYLKRGINLAYRPVMHQNIGLRYDEDPDAFWQRALEKMNVSPDQLFPMVTPADGDTILPYFNAGCLIVRPEKGLLQQWGQYFERLYQDSILTRMCREDIRKRIFIHQVALTGAILNNTERDQITELSNRYNYPIFFEQMFGARRRFNDITDVVTFRHESYWRDPAPDWAEQLIGPADRIEWMQKHLGVQAQK